jgi:hypothetical protein
MLKLLADFEKRGLLFVFAGYLMLISFPGLIEIKRSHGSRIPVVGWISLDQKWAVESHKIVMQLNFARFFINFECVSLG